ncbi:MAG: DNA gyrase inhibitor YacG [Myxococcaceae bacterium]|nr:DNA gyrase inhibitor YacG [Myxococcaceae bacterium]MCA3015542.1 DNA gyrase inhibitor YacG [Myxococcaceae bacterium]
MAKAACPTCDKPLASPEARPPFPFCSERCRAIDLGKWLGEEFRIPLRHDEEDEDGARPPRRPLDA